VRKHRRVATERVVCRLDMSGTPSDALVLADIEFADDEFAGVSGAPADPTLPPVSPPPISPPVPPPPVSPQQTPQQTPPAAPPAAPYPHLALRRAGQRWSALVSAPTSRVARLMHPALGDARWAAFLAHATERYKPAFLAAFAPPTLRCVGQAGRPCPHGFVVTPASPNAPLEHLHVDHEQDVQITCDMWRAALPPAPASWDDGIDGGLLCHLLFGVRDDPVHGPPMLRFRCGPSGLGSDAGYCHQLNMPHYRGLRDVAV